MFEFKFDENNIPKNISAPAITLPTYYVTDDDWRSEGTYSKTHDNGWTITGEIQEDYYVWVNEFTAIHPKYGKVWGNFEGIVYADSEEGFNNFYNYFQPQVWDYYDI